jgi:hypothetical protein
MVPICLSASILRTVNEAFCVALSKVIEQSAFSVNALPLSNQVTFGSGNPES